LEPRPLDDDAITGRVARDVGDIIDALELAGIVARADADGGAPDHGAAVGLTPAGAVAARRLLVAAGYDVAVAGRFKDATATELLTGVYLDDPALAEAEVLTWRRRRSPHQAAVELADAVRQLGHPVMRKLALSAMADLAPHLAGPLVRELAAEPATCGAALCWLVDHQGADQRSLFDPDNVVSFVDVLADRLIAGGPERLTQTLALAGSRPAGQGDRRALALAV